MHLTDLCLDLIEIPNGTDTTLVTGLAVDSARVKAGDLFFAISGSCCDGRDYLDDVIKAGAVAVITGKKPLTNQQIAKTKKITGACCNSGL